MLKFFAGWATRCRAIEKQEKAKTILIAMHSSSILRHGSKRIDAAEDPQFRSIPGRRKCLETRQMWGGSIVPKVIRLKSAHDFPDTALGKAVPCGVYDIAENEAMVSIGVSSDTAEFAVEAIRRWWQELGQERYGLPSRLLITADSGGSNAHRSRLWKLELQQLANETGMKIVVCHYPPGTSKWNTIEHRLFCHITRDWRGVPLETHQVVVNLVS